MWYSSFRLLQYVLKRSLFIFPRLFIKKHYNFDEPCLYIVIILNYYNIYRYIIYTYRIKTEENVKSFTGIAITENNIARIWHNDDRRVANWADSRVAWSLQELLAEESPRPPQPQDVYRDAMILGPETLLFFSSPPHTPLIHVSFPRVPHMYTYTYTYTHIYIYTYI